jgi:hypothetical protein
MPEEAPDSTSQTLAFDKFWNWLQAHRNCIVRVGTPYSVLMDHEDFHWEILAEDADTQILQLVRGKELVGEVIVLAAEIAYVHCPASDTEEQIFECVVETADAREVAYHFVIAHGYDEEPSTSGRWTH